MNYTDTLTTKQNLTKMHEQNEKFNKEIETTKKQTEILALKNTRTELKNSIELQKQTQPCQRITDIEDMTFWGGRPSGVVVRFVCSTLATWGS